MPKQIKQDRIEERIKPVVELLEDVSKFNIDKARQIDEYYCQLFPQPLEKCPKCDGSGRVYICVGQMNEFYEKCPDCKGSGKLPQPLDDKGLREKIRDRIVYLATGIMIIVGKLKPEDLEDVDKDKFEQICGVISNQIFALLQPKIDKLQKKIQTTNVYYLREIRNNKVEYEAKIDEARKEGFDDGVSKTTIAMDSTIDAQLGEAVKREMERIRGLLRIPPADSGYCLSCCLLGAGTSCAYDQCNLYGKRLKIDRNGHRKCQQCLGQALSGKGGE